MDGCCVCLVSNAAYQQYLDFALWQLRESGLKTFVICDDDVGINGCAERIRASEQPLVGGIDEYPPNPTLAGSFKKLAIPYAEQLRGFGKVLYVDIDVELRDGWTSVFDHPQSKPILAAKDAGIGSFFAKSNRMEAFYKNRPFEYCNTGVMLFDLGKWTMPQAEMRKLIDAAFENRWIYADQDILNASGLIDASLDGRFNTFSHFAKKETLISHYTAALDAKDRFKRLIAERMPPPK